jgi:SAM-dependent methyltransferase
MHYGTRDVFEYFECASCGCLQLKEIPINLGTYYPEDYYSFRVKKIPGPNPFRTFLRRQRSKYCLFGKNKIWPFRMKKYGSFNWLKKTKVKFDSSILDVGCGSGKLLNRMRRDGFQNLTGVDPFIHEDLIYPNGVCIFKKDIFQIEGQFDLIISNDSFEQETRPSFTYTGNRKSRQGKEPA